MCKAIYTFRSLFFSQENNTLYITVYIIIYTRVNVFRVNLKLKNTRITPLITYSEYVYTLPKSKSDQLDL